MAQFEVTTSAGSGSVVVSLSGDVDLTVRDELTATLLAAVASSRVVIVDVGAVTFMDSSGIHGLVTAYRAAKQDGTQVHAVHAQGVIRDLFDITGVGELLRCPSDGGGPPQAADGHQWEKA